MKVLLAQHHATSEKPLQFLLEQWGYEPLIINHAQEALDMLQASEGPELALLDHNLPGLDELEELQKIRESSNPYPPYVILLNDEDNPAKIVEGLEGGGDDYVTHPSQKAEFKARVHVGERMVQLYRKLDEARTRLAREAIHDSLTGALNRKGIFDRLHQELSRAKRNRNSVGVGMCDIDHFKVVNDTYGHQAGDQILRGIVHCIRNNLREYDSVGRYGGEEFLIVTPDVNQHTVGNIFSRLRRNIAQTSFSTETGEISVTASFGIIYSGYIDQADALVAAADRALYRAKDKGRNQVVQAEPAPSNEIQQ